MSYFEAGCRCLLALVFAVAAASKLRDRAGFAASVAALAPFRLPAPVVVAAEVATALALLFPVTARAGYVLAIVLLGAFTAAVVRAYRRGRRVRCACFGSGSVAGPRHVVRNGILAGVALAGLLASDAGSAVRPAGAAVAIAAGLLCGALLIVSDDLIELFAWGNP